MMRLALATHALTYAQLLALFVVAPIVALATLVAWDWLRPRGAGERAWREPALVTLLVLIAVATLYTIPWDDHLIATGVWFYQARLLIGVFAGHIPLEELLFFPLQTLLIGLWFLWLAPRIAPPTAHPDSGGESGGGGNVMWRVALGALGALGALVWLGALLVLRAGWRPGTYLGWEVIWALPPLLAQALIGGDILWRRRWLVAGVMGPVALYLCGVDALAIGEGIWTIAPHQSLGVMIGGALPLEELVFFLTTTALVTFGLVLGTAAAARGRVASLFSRAGGAGHADHAAPPASARARP